MKCPYCGEEMIRGYLMSSRDITFAVDNLTKVFRIKKSDDLELSKGSEGIPHCEAYRCNSCRPCRANTFRSVKEQISPYYDSRRRTMRKTQV